MNSLRVFRNGVAVGRQDFGIFWNWKTWLGGWMFRMFCNAVTWVLLGKALGSQEQVHFLLIGMGVFQGVAAIGWTVAASTWDRYEGVYPLLVISPSSLVPSVAGRTSVWLLNGLATSLGTFVILIGIFGLPMTMPGSLFAPFAVLLTCVSYYSFALFLGSLTIRVPQLRNVVHGIAATVIMAFCGVSVPIEFWPRQIGWIAGLLPVTHGLRSIRLLFSHGSSSEVLWGLFLEVVIGLAWLGLSFATMDALANSGRSDGSIEFV